MEPLFPELPEDLSALSDDELASLLEEHEVAVSKIDNEDPDYIGDLSAADVLAALEAGVEQIEAIKSEQADRDAAAEAYRARKAELTTRALGEDETVEETPAEELSEETPEATEEEAPEELAVEDEPDEPVAVEEPIVAAADPAPAPVAPVPQRVFRRPPAPSPEREAGEKPVGTALVAAAGVEGVRAGTKLDRIGLAEAMIEAVTRRARPRKHEGGVEEKVLIASAHYEFPEDMILRPNDPSGNSAKIAKLGNPFLGPESTRTLVASGGLCAPLTPFYDIPDLSVTDRPVRDALPSFQAERGGVSVPSVSTIGDIDDAITVIEESEDALGGTFATKSCQDLTCPTWTDVAVGIISHCREYGNLNARAWPEGVAHENAITMSAHARTAEARLLDRIKTLSINVTGGAATLSAWSHVVYALTRTAASIRYVLRSDTNLGMQALLPEWLPELLVTDQVSLPVENRFMPRATAVSTLRAYGIEPTFYKDTPSTGTSQGFADETASTIDNFPTVAQIAVYLPGTFLHLDGGVLELGLVRDSTLNSTNDYQVFGETFENVARIGPTQAARWLSLTICPVGSTPALGTALSCA